MEILDPYEVGECLTLLPRDLPKAYGSVIERMRDKAFAGRILGWILDAQRSMKMIELCVALNFHCEPLAFVEGYRPSPQSIIKTCGGLIEHNEENDQVTFSHTRAREYLTENRLDMMASHSTMALTCLTYCQNPNLKNPNDQDFQNENDGSVAWGERASKKLPFTSYAVNFWAVHSKLAGRNVLLETKIFETFNSRQRHLSVIYHCGYTECPPDGHFLQLLIHTGVTFLVMSPLSDASFTSMYILWNDYHTEL